MAEVTRPSKATNDCAGQLLLESGIWDHEEDGHAVVDDGDDLNDYIIMVMYSFMMMIL